MAHGSSRSTRTVSSLHAGGDHANAKVDGALDPVCGMTVDPHTTPHRHTHQGRTLLFLLRRLPHEIRRRPAEISRRRAQGRGRRCREGTIYTCPMHPEIRQVGPGACPICGMALEPEIATAEAGPNPELADMTRRFWIGARARGAGVRAGDGRAPRRRARLDRPDAVELAAVRLGDAGGAVGRLAVLRARLAIAASRATSTCSR